jgi:hypothetical protein
MAAPAVFLHTETMDAERRPAVPITPSRLAEKIGRHSGDGSRRFRRAVRNRLEPVRNALGPCRDETLIEKPFSLARTWPIALSKATFVPGRSCRSASQRQFRALGIDDDQGHPPPIRLLDPGPDHWMGLCLIGPHHYIRIFDLAAQGGMIQASRRTWAPCAWSLNHLIEPHMRSQLVIVE